MAVHGRISLAEPQEALGHGSVFSVDQPLGFPTGGPSRSCGGAQGSITNRLYCYLLCSGDRTIELKIAIGVYTLEMC